MVYSLEKVILNFDFFFKLISRFASIMLAAKIFPAYFWREELDFLQPTKPLEMELTVISELCIIFLMEKVANVTDK